MGSEPRVWRLVCALLIVVIAWILLCFNADAQNSPTQAEATAQQPLDQPTGQVSGHVYRADTGEPIAKASVTIASTRPTALGNSPQVLTALDGSFVFSGIAPGTYAIYVRAAGFVARAYGQGLGGVPQMVSLGAGQKLENLDVRLVAGGIVSGTVFDEDNKPVKDVMVAAVSVRYQLGGREQQVTGGVSYSDDLGNFRLSALRPGLYFLRAGGWRTNSDHTFTYRENYYPGTNSLENAQTIKVTSGTEISGIRLTVTTEPAYTISGMIIDPGAKGKVPARRYDVEISPKGELQHEIDPFDASSEMSFSKRGLPAGTYTVAVTAFDSAPTEEGWAVSGVGYRYVQLVDGDAHVKVEISNGAEVRGKVNVDGSQSLSAVGYYIDLVPMEGGRQWVEGGPIGQNGEFDIRDIPPGRYAFEIPVLRELAYQKRVRCSGGDYTARPVEFDVGTVLNDCEITLSRDLGAMRGEVLDDSHAISGMLVVLIPESRELRQLEGYTQIAQVGTNGQFQMSTIIPGNYFLFAVTPSDDQSYYALDFADRNGSYAQRVSVKAGETEVTSLKPFTKK